MFTCSLHLQCLRLAQQKGLTALEQQLQQLGVDRKTLTRERLCSGFCRRVSQSVRCSLSGAVASWLLSALHTDLPYNQPAQACHWVCFHADRCLA